MNKLKEQIEGYQQTHVMMFTRIMDNLSKFNKISDIVGTTATDNYDPDTYNESLSTINKLPCQSIEQLQTLNDALVDNDTLKTLLVCTILFGPFGITLYCSFIFNRFPFTFCF